MEHSIEPLNIEILTHQPASPHLTNLTTSAHIKNNPTGYPIHSIIDHYIKPTKDKYKIIKKKPHIPMPMDTTQWHNLQQKTSTKRFFFKKIYDLPKVI